MMIITPDLSYACIHGIIIMAYLEVLGGKSIASGKAHGVATCMC